MVNEGLISVFQRILISMILIIENIDSIILPIAWNIGSGRKRLLATENYENTADLCPFAFFANSSSNCYQSQHDGDT